MTEPVWIVLAVLAAVTGALVATFAVSRPPRVDGARSDGGPPPANRPAAFERRDLRRHREAQLDDLLALNISREGRIRLLTQWRYDLLRLDARRAHDAQLLRDIDRALSKLRAQGRKD